MQSGAKLLIVLSFAVSWSACTPLGKPIADFNEDGGPDAAIADSGPGSMMNAQGMQAGNSSSGGASGANSMPGSNGTPASGNGAAAAGGSNGVPGTGPAGNGSNSQPGGAATGATPPTPGNGGSQNAGGDSAANGGAGQGVMVMGEGGMGGNLGGPAGSGPMTPACVPADEQCDGKDNDCDSKIDEDVPPMPCGNATPPCKQGAKVCTNGTWSNDCPGEVGPQKEICDGKDNDCNGVPDEGCDCTNGAKEDCGMSSTAPCRKGTHTCVNGKWPTTCEGNIDPKAEVCDGVDNNCNNQIDDGKDALCGGGMRCGSRGCVACTTNAHCSTNNECEVPRCDSNGTCTTDDASSSTSCNGGRGKCSGGSCCTPSCSPNECGVSNGCGGTCPDNCGSSRMCENGQCVAKPVMKREYESCSASSNAQGDCGPNLICIAIASSTAHCMAAPPCAGFSQPGLGGWCSRPCQGPEEASGGFVANATGCEGLAAQRCWENALTEALNDGLCIP